MADSNHTTNASIKAIPAAFALGLVPHLYCTTRLMAATKGKMSIAMPRTNLDTWRTTLPTNLFNHLARSRGAHLNSMEVFPLFATAMIAGNAARLPAKDLNTAAVTFLAARTVYMGLYMGIKSDALAFARTGVYAWSISIPLLVLWRAGNAMA